MLTIALVLLLLIAVMDARSGMIADVLSIPFIVVSALVAWSSGHIVDGLLAGTVGAGFFGVQWILSRGQWVGSGDIGLALGIGLLLGDMWLLLLALWIAYIAGALMATVLLIRKRAKRKDLLAFGPFLAGGAYVSFFWGEKILGLIGL